ncbi:sodium-dependent transporter [Pusillimonas noertemannii]|uniref:NSS family neurotransmitter:Na+ symporter n=1 Tax=Pusillimonas noertemannii TaxID=305977 RepID=A0A2U1CQD1_9BURK|nr:sodium-dependent transporter [Pusillimonas noertemannii]NYT67423.1 sodium-dependent transporter [Pusillimonas noertemannii]PVY68096.1 NSS family neurotransmitter:Na+ symporter [Pusillimonas noertemannii]TFL12398.1 sodium-dependent transporter [Pusillimonas noertemannii]
MDRAQWGSNLGFILAATGSAVGLGAIWKFPYVTAHQGSGAFLLLFTLLTLTIGLGLLRVEMTIGRAGNAGAFGAYRKLGGTGWGLVGLLGVLASATILSYYSVVGGWTIAYIWQTMTTALTRDPDLLRANFSALAEHPWLPLFYHALFMLATVGGVVGGVQGGIERISKVLMPCLFLMMCLLIVRGLMVPGAWAGVSAFLVPDFAGLTMQSVLDALGLSFFTLSLALGIMTTYGSYLPASANLNRSALTVALLTLLSCVMGGLLVLPPAYALGLDQGAGPSLTFVTMPMVFSYLPWGNLFGTVFFALLFIAALTSSISMLEVVVAFLMEHAGQGRRAACAIAGIGLFLVGVLASLSMTGMPALQWGERNAFEWLDTIATNVMLPVGGLFTALFAGWVIWHVLQKEWHGAPRQSALAAWRRLLIGLITPIAIGFILWNGLRG